MNIQKLKEWVELAQSCGDGDYWEPLLEGKGETGLKKKPAKPEYPAVDIYRSDSEITVLAELPGVRKEELCLSVCGNVLRLKGQPRKIDAAGVSVQSERFTGSFDRQVQLPSPVDGSAVSANLTDGLLTIRFRVSGNAGEPILLD